MTTLPRTMVFNPGDLIIFQSPFKDLPARYRAFNGRPLSGEVVATSMNGVVVKLYHKKKGDSKGNIEFRTVGKLSIIKGFLRHES